MPGRQLALPGVPTDELIPTGETGRILFIAGNDDIRSNLGLVNGSDLPITVSWQLYAADGRSLGAASMAPPACGNTQINRVLEAHEPVDVAYIEVWKETADADG